MKIARLLLSLSFLASTPSFAKKGQKDHWKKIIHHLDLSEQQKSQMKSVREDSKSDFKSMRAELKENRRLFELALEEDKSELELRSAFMKLNESKSRMALFKFEQMLNIRKILNAEQRKKFHELKNDHNKRHGRHDKH